MDDAGRQQAAQAVATSGYFLAELIVPERPSSKVIPSMPSG